MSWAVSDGGSTVGDGDQSGLGVDLSDGSSGGSGGEKSDGDELHN